MNLKQFKDYIESFPDFHIFDNGISYPFSWRGSYDEVAFDIEFDQMSKEEVLKRIDDAYEDTFGGYKGGEYRYCDWTPIHFEENYGRYTDGAYCATIISNLEDKPTHISQEARLIHLAFK